MNREKFFEMTIELVNEKTQEIFGEGIEVNIREVIKNNDEKFHGVTLMFSESGCMPTIYLEDCYELHMEGCSVEEIAEIIVFESMNAYYQAEELGKFSFEYRDIQDKLVMQVIDGEKNEKRLNNLVFRRIGNGFVMIPYIVMHSNDEGSFRTAVTKEMAEDFGYNEDELMARAYMNTVEKCEPIFIGIDDVIALKDISRADNPMCEDIRINPNSKMYILSNTYQQDGAVVLFYPDMMRRIGELLGKNYYVLPSSVHEVLIVPEGNGFTLEMMRDVVKEVNTTTIDPKDLLSDKVMFYDREKDHLIVP